MRASTRSSSTISPRRKTNNRIVSNKPIRLLVNGEHRSFDDIRTVQALVSHLALDSGRIAVELNRRILKRSEFAETSLADGDRVELVHFVGGG